MMGFKCLDSQMRVLCQQYRMEMAMAGGSAYPSPGVESIT